MGRKSGATKQIQRMYGTLQEAMGEQHWWPAESAFEVVVGAYLTQNTAWVNVERAMGNLRTAGVLSVSGIRGTALAELEQLVRPAGYFRQKAARLQRFVAHLDAQYGGRLEAMFARPIGELREELLGLPGIGPETADSILLYAANREVFVVDSYTRRMFERHELADAGTGYDEIRLAVEKALAADGPGAGHLRKPAGAPNWGENHGITTHVPSGASQMARSELAQRYNEFHALIVQTAKHFCLKSKPKCERCPLRKTLTGWQEPR